MPPQIAIIGAGISGAIAYNALRSYKPTIYEGAAKRPCLDRHKAIMRIRDSKTALLLGCEVEKVKVNRMALWNGELTDRCTIQMNNEYSIKTAGDIRDKSIQHLGVVERLLIKGDIETPISDTCYEHCLEHVQKHYPDDYFSDVLDIHFYKPNVKQPFIANKFDTIISTIPLAVMCKACGIEIPEGTKFETYPITVLTGEIKIDCNIHQTVYVPEDHHNCYRVTIEGKKLMMECVEHPNAEEIDLMLSLFGLTTYEVSDLESHTQNHGKMTKVDEDVRRNLIYTLTDEFNIYSFGRFGIWKPIRTDHLIGDIEKIKRMISAGKYAINQERSK